MTDPTYDFDGQPISVHQWVLLCFDERQWVARTTLDDGTLISTIWTGLDAGLHDPPLIYETMIFGGLHDGRQYRWPGRHAALAGHDQTVALVREALTRARGSE